MSSMGGRVGENNYSHGRSRKIATPTLEHGWKDTFVSPRDFKYCLSVMTDLGRVSSTIECVPVLPRTF